MDRIKYEKKTRCHQKNLRYNQFLSNLFSTISSPPSLPIQPSPVEATVRNGTTTPDPVCEIAAPVELEFCWWYSSNSCCVDNNHPYFSEQVVKDAYLAWERECDFALCSQGCKDVIKLFFCRRCSPLGDTPKDWCQSFCQIVKSACAGTFEYFPHMGRGCKGLPTESCFNDASRNVTFHQCWTWLLFISTLVLLL